MRKPVVGGLDPRLLAAANALKGAHGPKSIPRQPQLLDRRRLKIDYGRPGEGKKKWARRRTVEVRRRGYDITKRVQPEPFSISRVVLDLDAEDSPYVRPYGFRRNANGSLVPYGDRKEQKNVWNHDPKLDALVKRMDDFKHEIRASEDKWHAPLELFDPRRSSKRDIMEVVLLGIGSEVNDKSLDANRSATSVGAKEPEPLRRFLQASGIPARVLSDEVKTLDFIAAWRREHAVSVPDRHNLPPSPVQGHAPWPGLHIFKRALAAHLGNGSEDTLPDEGNEICDAFWTDLGGNRSSSPWSTQEIIDGLRTEDPVEALALLHNIELRFTLLQFHDCHLPDRITNFAIELAVQTDILSTIPTFLYNSPPEVKKFAVETWLKKQKTTETTAEQRLDFLGLLIKKNAGSYDKEQDYFHKFSIRGVLGSGEGNYDVYEPYLQALGSIGAIRTLWHEWHSECSRAFPGGNRYEYEPNNIEEDASPMFVDALLRYRALRHSQDKGPITPVTGDFDDDLSLDRRDIASFRSTPAYYVEEMQRAKLGEDERFREECIRALNNPEISVAMEQLGRLLISEGSKA